MRPIDADKLKERWTITSPQPYSTDATEVLDSINEQPTIEAVPVVQGKWIFDKYTAKFGNPYRCSNCNEEFGDAYNFCPNCGAKMKGGAE